LENESERKKPRDCGEHVVGVSTVLPDHVMMVKRLPIRLFERRVERDGEPLRLASVAAFIAPGFRAAFACIFDLSLGRSLATDTKRV